MITNTPSKFGHRDISMLQAFIKNFPDWEWHMEWDKEGYLFAVHPLPFAKLRKYAHQHDIFNEGIASKNNADFAMAIHKVFDEISTAEAEVKLKLRSKQRAQQCAKRSNHLKLAVDNTRLAKK